MRIYTLVLASLTLAMSLTGSAALADGVTIIKAGSLFDSRSGKVTKNGDPRRG